MLIFLRIRRSAGNLVIDFGDKITEPISRILVEFALYVKRIVDQLLTFHLVKLALMLNLARYRLRSIPVILIRDGNRDFDHNILRAITLLHEMLPLRTHDISFLRQIDYGIAHHVIKQQP